MDRSRNVDHAYERFMKENSSSMLRAIEKFESIIHKSDFKFGRFTIPTFMKPHFLTREQERLLENVCDALVRMVDRVVNLYDQDVSIRKMFQLSQDAEDLVRIYPGYSQSAQLARLDSFLEGEAVKFLELNCDSPAGMGYADCAEDILFGLEELGSFFGEFQFDRIKRIEKLLQALLAAYEAFGAYETPQIAIVDWKTVRTRPEFEIIKRFFEEKGYKTIICDPRDLRLKGGKLYHGSFRVDLVYRRVIFSELLDRLRDVGDLIKAYRERAVCVVNPLRSRLTSSSTLLSIFSNPDYDHYFSAQENKIKSEHIPWTRRMSDAEKFYGNKKIYLIDFLKDEKETLVLKPANSYGGKDVTIGCDTKDQDWNVAIDKAFKENWMIQEYIRAPVFSVPTPSNRNIEFALKKISTGNFVLGGSFAGSFTRVSDENVINISRGGGLIPAIFCESDVSR